MCLTFKLMVMVGGVGREILLNQSYGFVHCNLHICQGPSAAVLPDIKGSPGDLTRIPDTKIQTAG